MKNIFENVLNSSIDVIESGSSRDEKLQSLCQLLTDKIPHYDWVGFYLVDAQNERELILGPYVGDPTDHVKIPFGRGICGQAAESGETFVVQDVSKEDNYLSCSVNVNSEIVLPIFKDGQVIGELDIDSHQISPFRDNDRIYLEKMCERIADLF